MNNTEDLVKKIKECLTMSLHPARIKYDPQDRIDAPGMIITVRSERFEHTLDVTYRYDDPIELLGYRDQTRKETAMFNVEGIFLFVDHTLFSATRHETLRLAYAHYGILKPYVLTRGDLQWGGIPKPIDSYYGGAERRLTHVLKEHDHDFAGLNVTLHLLISTSLNYVPVLDKTFGQIALDVGEYVIDAATDVYKKGNSSRKLLERV